MARPRRCRRICQEPAYDGFVPTGIGAARGVVLTVDEYEVIRLIDLEKLTHEQCASQIGVSRTTVTDIYETAREKLADCIVNGRPLTIAGGSYALCDGHDGCYLGGGCPRNREANECFVMTERGKHGMRIAVTHENGNVFGHFGRTASFAVYDVEDGKVVSRTIVGTNGSGHGALAGVLRGIGADLLLCGGIGGGAQNALAEAGIAICGGLTGSCDDAVAAYLSGALTPGAAPTCDHHHHGAHHDCGEHNRAHERG